MPPSPGWQRAGFCCHRPRRCFCPPRSSLVQRLVVALIPPPLILSTLHRPLNAQPRPIEAPLPLVHWCLSSRLPLVRRLVVASPVVACLRLASHFLGQPPHASILDPSSLFTPAGCCVASLRTASTSQRAGAIAGVIKCTAPVRPPARQKAPPTPLQRRCAAACAPQIVVGERRAVAIIVDFFARRAIAIIVDSVVVVARHHRRRRCHHIPSRRCPSRRRHRHRHRCRPSLSSPVAPLPSSLPVAPSVAIDRVLARRAAAIVVAIVIVSRRPLRRRHRRCIPSPVVPLPSSSSSSSSLSSSLSRHRRCRRRRCCTSPSSLSWSLLSSSSLSLQFAILVRPPPPSFDCCVCAALQEQTRLETWFGETGLKMRQDVFRHDNCE